MSRVYLHLDAAARLLGACRESRANIRFPILLPTCLIFGLQGAKKPCLELSATSPSLLQNILRRCSPVDFVSVLTATPGQYAMTVQLSTRMRGTTFRYGHRHQQLEIRMGALMMSSIRECWKDCVRLLKS